MAPMLYFNVFIFSGIGENVYLYQKKIVLFDQAMITFMLKLTGKKFEKAKIF